VASNIKPKTPAKEAPTEPFKRAVGVCLRAIAGKGDLEVSFAAERPGLAGGKARLPEPRGRHRARPRRFDRAAACLS
jgi:cobaltochelatase CobT